MVRLVFAHVIKFHSIIVKYICCGVNGSMVFVTHLKTIYKKIQKIISLTLKNVHFIE